MNILQASRKAAALSDGNNGEDYDVAFVCPDRERGEGFYAITEHYYIMHCEGETIARVYIGGMRDS